MALFDFSIFHFCDLRQVTLRALDLELSQPHSVSVMEITKEPGRQRLLQQMDRVTAAFTPRCHELPSLLFPSTPALMVIIGKETHRKWGAVGRTLFQGRIPNPVLFFPFGKQWCCFLHRFSSRRLLSILTVVQEKYRVDLSTPCHRCPAIQGSDFPTGRGIRGVGWQAELSEPGE